MSDILKLKDKQPIESGSRRLLFAHPDDPALIIKVFRPHFLARRWANPDWRHRRRRYLHLFPFFQEVREHIAVAAHEGRVPKFIQTVVGFVDTDYGMGIVSRAVFGPDGALAPRLEDIIRQKKYTAEVQQAYFEFKDWMIRSPVVVNDMRTCNIVCARDEAGKPYLVMVDGIGERTVLPFKGLLPWLNRRTKKRLFRLLERRDPVPAQPDPD